jgi:putative endonuclease
VTPSERGPAQRSRWREARRARYRLGLRAEWIAAFALRLRGYRILARRVKTPLGEIDLVAVRGRRLVFFEVKRRATYAECEAAITPTLRARVRRAASLWLARHPRYHAHDQGFDLVFLVPARWPRHIVNGL